jgi:hypothetical protein
MMPLHARRREPASSRSHWIPVLVGICFIMLACFPTGAAGASACAGAVVVDWSEDGHVDGVYPLSCYQAAIRQLPPDVRDYSTASDEINRALAVAVNQPTRSRDSTIVGQAAQAAASSGPNSFPAPLLALGGISVLVFAAGTAGYVARRLRSNS